MRISCVLGSSAWWRGLGNFDKLIVKLIQGIDFHKLIMLGEGYSNIPHSKD